MHVPTTFTTDLFPIPEGGKVVCISAEVNLMLISAALGMTGEKFDQERWD